MILNNIRKYPTKWKVSFVFHTKEGDTDNVVNYRLVSVTCTTSKVFEKHWFQ